MSTEIEVLEWLKSQLFGALTDDLSVYLLIERNISYQRDSNPNDPSYSMIRKTFRDIIIVEELVLSNVCNVVVTAIDDISAPISHRLSLVHAARGAKQKEIYPAVLRFFFSSSIGLTPQKQMSFLYDLEKFGFPPIEWKFKSVDAFVSLRNLMITSFQGDKFLERNSFLAEKFFESITPIVID